MPDRINPAALPPETLADLLRKGGCREAAEALERLAEAGLPANEDGTLNLIEFTAWLLKEVNRNGSEPDQT
jgi:hypothetical protein